VTIPEHIPIDELSPPILVVHGHKGFNVIKYLGSYWGVAQHLGSMDLTAVDAAKIDAYRLDGTVRISDTLEGVIESIDGA
ncbi:MAG: hypothetical protein J0653_04685, partial [Deltaproteobacteria bacterium]|nr:hypothetical protein [Deltaproteobacteria bacterium]